MKYIIQGGRKLEGEIEVSGNKNAIFPCVAAALLTQDEVILENMADLADTQVLVQILIYLGVKVDRRKTTLVINSKDLKSYVLPKELMTKLRGSIVLVGAILARKNKVNFYHPGGDIIGKRSINTHLEAFKSIGALLKKSDLEYSLRFTEQENISVSIFLQEASVTACENLILASVLGKKKVVLKNCPKEPHVEDLCKMLLQMGASIKGVGTDTLLICGVDKLSGTKFKIGIDYIEVGTYAVASAITGGKIKIFGLDKSNLDPVLEPLRRFGVKIETHDNYLVVSADKLISPVKIITNIWPGFPSDLMSVAIVLATQSKGVTLCHDWMYESRMFFVDKLISMGAQITLADPHRSLVYGPSKLKGRVIETPDIRAGMALVLAALVAKGESTINQIELIERGYENVVGKLTNLGADIKKYV
ncbi:MAG: UDP-N-acetylglucosamine 1-carboxyvinyltransferase [Candidatus Daviesbacteria bacterium]|nr:UDP-N-acetylglucosamine 1-carboxyvinyltransferase [Candidatus Daviesbacteria bacterium]